MPGIADPEKRHRRPHSSPRQRRKLGAEVMTWRIIPHVLQDRFKGSGTTTVRATAGGCERIITGDFTVSIPLMGGKLEAQLVEVISAGYDKGAGVLREMLAAG